MTLRSELRRLKTDLSAAHAAQYGGKPVLPLAVWGYIAGVVKWDQLTPDDQQAWHEAFTASREHRQLLDKLQAECRRLNVPLPLSLPANPHAELARLRALPSPATPR